MTTTDNALGNIDNLEKKITQPKFKPCQLVELENDGIYRIEKVVIEHKESGVETYYTLQSISGIFYEHQLKEVLIKE